MGAGFGVVLVVGVGEAAADEVDVGDDVVSGFNSAFVDETDGVA